MLFSFSANEKTVDLLIRSGANIHLKNKDEETPLALAALFNSDSKLDISHKMLIHTI